MPTAHPRPRPPWDSAAAAPPTGLVPRHASRVERWRAARLARRAGVTVQGTVSLGRDVRVEVAPGARLVLGDRCALLDGCRIHVRGGRLDIGAGTVLGERCAVVVHERVALGEGCRLGDGVVVTDASPVYDDPERPARAQGVTGAPVTVGRLARIGPGAVLEAGTAVPPLTAVAAHRVLSPAIR